MSKARETFLPGSKAHQDMIATMERGQPWFMDGLPYRPAHIRKEGRYIVVDLELDRERTA